MEKPSAYIIGIYYEEEGVNHLEGIAEEDIYIVMKNSPENMAHAKELLGNFKQTN